MTQGELLRAVLERRHTEMERAAAIRRLRRQRPHEARIGLRRRS